ncbi:hypothetical protein P154DRAFT_619391 [Amniculicola lignicola CBS 123094]|uniref:Uncharacterized protein n=1 Tax=Amniculicola lignicola CBS 123094 TaxID=1392246 RepID=A0A6A5WIV4_9PLEO|nr:hypothetical protein P154DRAFT_619391 [Amniculicola lignicola CBS 123094]
MLRLTDDDFGLPARGLTMLYGAICAVLSCMFFSVAGLVAGLVAILFSLLSAALRLIGQGILKSVCPYQVHMKVDPPTPLVAHPPPPPKPSTVTPPVEDPVTKEAAFFLRKWSLPPDPEPVFQFARPLFPKVETRYTPVPRVGAFRYTEEQLAEMAKAGTHRVMDLNGSYRWVYIPPVVQPSPLPAPPRASPAVKITQEPSQLPSPPAVVGTQEPVEKEIGIQPPFVVTTEETRPVQPPPPPPTALIAPATVAPPAPAPAPAPPVFSAVAVQAPAFAPAVFAPVVSLAPLSAPFELFPFNPAPPSPPHRPIQVLERRMTLARRRLRYKRCWPTKVKIADKLKKLMKQLRTTKVKSASSAVLGAAGSASCNPPPLVSPSPPVAPPPVDMDLCTPPPSPMLVVPASPPAVPSAMDLDSLPPPPSPQPSVSSDMVVDSTPPPPPRPSVPMDMAAESRPPPPRPSGPPRRPLAPPAQTGNAPRRNVVSGPSGLSMLASAAPPAAATPLTGAPPVGNGGFFSALGAGQAPAQAPPAPMPVATPAPPPAPVQDVLGARQAPPAQAPPAPEPAATPAPPAAPVQQPQATSSAPGSASSEAATALPRAGMSTDWTLAIPQLLGLSPQSLGLSDDELCVWDNEKIEWENDKLSNMPAYHNPDFRSVVNWIQEQAPMLIRAAVILRLQCIYAQNRTEDSQPMLSDELSDEICLHLKQVENDMLSQGESGLIRFHNHRGLVQYRRALEFLTHHVLVDPVRKYIPKDYSEKLTDAVEEVWTRFGFECLNKKRDGTCKVQPYLD